MSVKYWPAKHEQVPFMLLVASVAHVRHIVLFKHTWHPVPQAWHYYIPFTTTGK